jgi:DNA repair and recombination protein RAD52
VTFTPDQVTSLRAKLDKSHVKRNPKGFDYVEGWHAIAEANRIFGFASWNRETLDMRQLGEPEQVNGNWRVAYLCRVRVTVWAGDKAITRDGTGYGSGIGKDIRDVHESAAKEAETDAMKRSLMTFGNPFGLALYDKAQANVETAPPPPAKPAADPEAIETYLATAEGIFREFIFTNDDMDRWMAKEKTNRENLGFLPGTKAYDRLGQMVKEHRKSIGNERAAA